MAELLATVAILTYNGEKYLRRILEQVTTQEIDGAYDVLVIDSGSTDATLEIVASFPEVRLHQIPNSEFGHGRTRNLAARLSRGEFTAYLTHDAIPTDESWLAELTAPMRANDSVAGVMGRQTPRPGCVPLQKYEIIGVFGNAGPADRVSVYAFDESMTDAEIARATFYSDVNSAARTSVLLDQFPYRDVPYAEDQFFGRDIIHGGLSKAYAPQAVVEHSNDLKLSEYRARIFDETVGLRRLDMASHTPMSMYDALRLTLRGIVGDTIRIRYDLELPLKSKLKWWVLNPWFHVAKWQGVRSASRVRMDDEAALAKGSLESRRKKSN